MDTSELMARLDRFFDLSDKKQKKKQAKLLKIIHKLEEKKASLEAEVVRESKIDDTSVRYQDLSQEFKVVTRLLVKARKQKQHTEAD